MGGLLSPPSMPFGSCWLVGSQIGCHHSRPFFSLGFAHILRGGDINRPQRFTIRGVRYTVLRLSHGARGPRFLLRDDQGRIFGASPGANSIFKARLLEPVAASFSGRFSGDRRTHGEPDRAASPPNRYNGEQVRDARHQDFQSAQTASTPVPTSGRSPR